MENNMFITGQRKTHTVWLGCEREGVAGGLSLDFENKYTSAGPPLIGQKEKGYVQF